MRIAMFTNNYKPYIGGVPVSIEHLAAALRQRGHEVYVFAPSYTGKKAAECGEDEKYVIRYPSFPVKIAGAPVPDVLTGLFKKKVRELEIDVIHVHHPAIVGNVALYIRKKTGIPVVFTYHTRYEEYLHYIAGLEKFERCTGFFDWYLKKFSNSCDMIIAPTKGIRDYLLEKGVVTPIGIMATGIPADSYEPDMEAAEEIRRKNLRGGDYLFCTVSRLAVEKNLIFQLEGLASLKKMFSVTGKTFRHLMIGDGPQKAELLKKIRELDLEENVILVGNVDNREIKNYQKAADLFLFTSKSETQGIVLLEAMAVGNPVVAVNATGVCDIIEDGKNGYLTAEDANVWAERISYLMQKRDVRKEMGQEAEKTAEQYSEALVAELAEVYYCNCIERMKAEQEVCVPFSGRYVI